MSSAQRKNDINLLPQKGLESNTFGRVLAWILSSFRIIVIVTEIIVMIAFLSRFWLDAQNSDLTEEIEQKITVLEASSNFEKEFKDIQARTSVLKTLYSSPKLSSFIKDISNSLPPDVFLTSISTSNEEIKVIGSTSNEISIHQYIVNLSSNPLFPLVNLTDISSDKQDIDSLNFSINVKRKQSALELEKEANI